MDLKVEKDPNYYAIDIIFMLKGKPFLHIVNQGDIIFNRYSIIGY